MVITLRIQAETRVELLEALEELNKQPIVDEMDWGVGWIKLPSGKEVAYTYEIDEWEHAGGKVFGNK